MFFQRGKSNQVIYYLIAAFILILCVEGLVIAAKKGDNKNNSASFKLPVWIQGNGKLPKWELTLDEFKIIQGKSLLEATSLKKPESPTMLFIAFIQNFGEDILTLVCSSSKSSKCPKSFFAE